jgi:hypothetical protein
VNLEVFEKVKDGGFVDKPRKSELSDFGVIGVRALERHNMLSTGKRPLHHAVLPALSLNGTKA